MRFLCCLLALATCARAATPAPPDADEAAYPAIERFVEVLETVRKRHPDVDKLAYDRLVNHALEGMLSSLDPHSSFIHPEMAALMKENATLHPENPSLGLTLALRDDGPYISAVAARGAAADAGVLPGSSLLEVNGRKVEGVAFSDVLSLLGGAPGEQVKLRLKSPAEPRPLEVALIHRVVEERSVADSHLLAAHPAIGYLRLATFGGKSAREVEAALDDLEDKGMKSLILDLRQNGGGDLYQTVEILGLFLPPGTAVVTTRSRDAEAAPPLKTPDRQRRKRSYPIVVLIDRMSASASELTAGALQDLKRATVIGELSYGKGSVQNIIPMGGGTALRLTIATYHTPSGNTPHLKGITPDLAIPITSQDARDFLLSCQMDSLPPEERQRLQAWNDPVLAAAITKLTSK